MGHGGGEPDSRAKGVDPTSAVTVSEAAELAGVSPGRVREAIRGGQLLHETGRRRGRQVTLVRVVDLAALWPAALDGGEEDSASPAAAPSEAREEREERQERGEERELRREEDRSLAVRLAAVQAANEALEFQVRDLRLQRSDLKDQMSDLRGRLTLVERERQAGTAALLMAQRRLLELEAAPPATPAHAAPVLPPRRPGWRTVSVWAAGAGLVLWTIASLRTDARDAREEARLQRGDLSLTLDEGRRDRARFYRELAHWREAAAVQREHSEAQSEALLLRLEEAGEREARLAGALGVALANLERSRTAVRESRSGGDGSAGLSGVWRRILGRPVEASATLSEEAQPLPPIPLHSTPPSGR